MTELINKLKNSTSKKRVIYILTVCNLPVLPYTILESFFRHTLFYNDGQYFFRNVWGRF